MSPSEKPITANQALTKLMRYCAYQERCHQDVSAKLSTYGLSEDEIGNIIAKLIEDDFLNEGRFVELYIRGKLFQKHWGKRKIEQGLKQKNIYPTLIREGINQIDQDAYVSILKKVLEKKVKLSRFEDNYNGHVKLAKYLIQRGFEADLVWQEIKLYYGK